MSVSAIYAKAWIITLSFAALLLPFQFCFLFLSVIFHCRATKQINCYSACIHSAHIQGKCINFIQCLEWLTRGKASGGLVCVSRHFVVNKVNMNIHMCAWCWAELLFIFLHLLVYRVSTKHCFYNLQFLCDDLFLTFLS